MWGKRLPGVFGESKKNRQRKLVKGKKWESDFKTQQAVREMWRPFFD